MPLITIRDAVELAVETFGQSEHPLVLLIPGAGAPAEFWPECVCSDLAARGFHVVRYNHRDTGRSTHFDEPYPIEELLQDLFSLIEVLGKQPVHLVGHSMGGFLAQMAACRQPESIATITSISAGSTVSPEVAARLDMSAPSEETWEILTRNQPTGDITRDLPGWMQSWRFLNGSRPFDEQAAARYTEALYVGDPRNAQVAVNHVHAMSAVPASLADQLTGVRCPVQVIHGTNDPLVPLDHGEATARLAPNSRLFRLQGAGHMFFDEDSWREILEAVAAHVARGTRRPT